MDIESEVAGKSVSVRKSDIHGKGLFAQRSFKAGEKVGEFKGAPAKREGMHVIFIPVEKKEKWSGIIRKEGGQWWKALKIANEFKFLNHSSRPNCEAREIEIVALRNIRPGEEMTIHYGDDWD